MAMSINSSPELHGEAAKIFIEDAERDAKKAKPDNLTTKRSRNSGDS